MSIFLLPDGTMVKETTQKVGFTEVRVCDVYRNWHMGISHENYNTPEQAISIDEGFIPLFKDSYIKYGNTSTENGSDNSRKLGLAVQNIVVRNKHGYAILTNLPFVFSSQVRVLQWTDTWENIVEKKECHGTQVRKLVDKPKKESF